MSNCLSLSFFKSLVLILVIMLSVAFLTLVERKFLALFQIRKGPNKVGVFGLFQPFSDAMKLLSKQLFFPEMSIKVLFATSPMISFCLVMILWMSYPSLFSISEINLSLIFLLCCFGMSVYSLIFSGWASNSKYSQIGSIRSLAQSISYEVSLAFILISLVILIKSLNSNSFFLFSLLLLFSPILGFMWMVSFLAETHRTPFDFAEAESELVSGFNTEYSSGGFVLFFLAEYSSILFVCSFFSVSFMYLVNFPWGLSIFSSIMCFLMIWIRGSLPRLRYDMLMMLAWKYLMPSSIIMLLYVFSVSVMIYLC